MKTSGKVLGLSAVLIKFDALALVFNYIASIWRLGSNMAINGYSHLFKKNSSKSSSVSDVWKYVGCRIIQSCESRYDPHLPFQWSCTTNLL